MGHNLQAKQYRKDPGVQNKFTQQTKMRSCDMQSKEYPEDKRQHGIYPKTL